MTKLIQTLTVLLLTASGFGCATTVRYVTTQHWHGDDSFFVAYSEHDEIDYFVTRGATGAVAHVLKCDVSADNSVHCREQIAIDRLLNPDRDYPPEAAPPPPPAPPPPSPAPPAEGAPAPLSPPPVPQS